MRPKPKKLKFKVSAGIKNIVGRDLITDDNIAVFELVKNSYDAHATKVKISFLDINGEEPKIIVEDNGKGMSLADLENKWLFLAYSAKKEGVEDKDYRSKINLDKPFAGSKGIGRFSSDRLGKKLLLETIKETEKTRREILEIDWTKFENRLSEEFIKIPVIKHPSKPAHRREHGTKLTITDLRDAWNRKKIVSLRKSLSKLINPDSNLSSQKFKITINCPEELITDKNTVDYERVNGDIKNFIFEELEIRTTRINVRIDDKGKYVETELRDGGTLIYKIKEKNAFTKTLYSVNYSVFYLNKAAKDTFKRRMGVRTRDYGSIFVYKNNIRIYPYGEPTEDSFNLDKMKSQKPSVKLGNKDLIGRIEIENHNELNETSSRGDGFINNDTYQDFLLSLQKYVIERLERYVIDVQKWGGGSYLSIEDDDLGATKNVLQNRITSLISRISNSNDIVDFEYDDNILTILDEKQSDSAVSLVNNLFRIAKESKNKKLLRAAEKTKERVEELRTALIEAQKESDEKQKKLDEQVSENLFLKSIKSQDFDEIISFLHHIGISANITDNYLTGLYKGIEANRPLASEYIQKLLRTTIFENKKIINISKFATKANFKLYTNAIELNLDEYIKEYINNIVILSTGNQLKIDFVNTNNQPLILKFRPIEINILIDNLLNNSKKAKSTSFNVKIYRNAQKEYEIAFEDNGLGISKENIDQIFEFGYTTTSGSGIGLFHVKEIVQRLNGKITVISKLNKGTKFLITLQ